MIEVAAIVPAYNEYSRIGQVLKALIQVELISEIIVVSDGSTDPTYEYVKGFERVKAIELRENIGKAGAIKLGVANTNKELLLFLDADLIGIQPAHIYALLLPVLQKKAAMTIGCFCGGRLLTDLSHKWFPWTSGQRCLPRELFLSIPDLKYAGYALEFILTRYFERNGLKILKVPLHNVTHVRQEEKYGFFKGLGSRLKMYSQIWRYMFSIKKDA